MDDNSIENLKELMRNGIVSFKYQKVNGEFREAKGTLNLDNIPEDQHPKGVGESNDDIVKYYDVEKESWRSFRSDSFIGII